MSDDNFILREKAVGDHVCTCPEGAVSDKCPTHHDFLSPNFAHTLDDGMEDYIEDAAKNAGKGVN